MDYSGDEADPSDYVASRGQRSGEAGSPVPAVAMLAARRAGLEDEENVLYEASHQIRA
jgi:hypothetical protein